MAVRKVRNAADSANAATIANTTAVVNTNNIGDLPTTVNAILTALAALGFTKLA